VRERELTRERVRERELMSEGPKGELLLFLGYRRARKAQGQGRTRHARQLSAPAARLAGCAWLRAVQVLRLKPKRLQP